MASIALTTAGITVKYAVEGTAGTRPSTGFIAIPDVKAIPEFGGAPNTLQTTTLAATKFHTYTKGLQAAGGAVALTVNDTVAFRTAWDAVMAAYEGGISSGKRLWIEYAYPAASGMESWYYPAEPCELAFGGAEVDAVLETTAYLIPTGEPEFDTASA